jgi:hypothetical protein
VGGASLYHALHISVGDIKTLGQWKTDCYQQYIKPIAGEDIATSLSILELPTFDPSLPLA